MRGNETVDVAVMYGPGLHFYLTTQAVAWVVIAVRRNLGLFTKNADDFQGLTF